MAKKRLNIKDKTGLPVDYDISAENVTIDGAGGKPLTQKLDEIAETEAQAVRSITFNGQSYSRDNGSINIGEQEQPNWNESNPNYRTFIRNKPDVVNDLQYDAQTRTLKKMRNGVVQEVVTLPDGGSQVQVDDYMSSTSENAVQNKVIKAFVENLINGIIDGAPAALDTLKELADAMADSDDAVAALTAAISGKADKSEMGVSESGDKTTITLGQGKTAQVINQHQSLSSYATKSELNGKQDRLTGSDVLATINSTQVHYGESVNIEGQKGDKGDKGDTGDCELRQGDDVVSIIKNDFSGGTGYIASAELAKTLNDKSIGKGTYGQAWAHSQLSGQLFPWIWDETISGDAVLKPIWHIGNGRFIDAVGAEITIDGIAASTPTFSQEGGEVIGGTQVTIIPSAGALLYVAINSSSPTVSETAQKITINQARMVIDAWCATYGGESAHVTNTYTAAAPSVPTFNPSTDGAATRNMALTVTPASGCELHYKVNDGIEQTSQGALSTTILAEDYIYKIEAWSYDSSTQMQSTHVTKTYTIARPNAPIMPDSGTVERGASITIGRNNASGSIKYKVGSATPLTVEGDTATVQLTAQQSTIEAWVELNGETSEHVTENYTMAALNPPVFSPSGGEVLEGAQVTISAAPGAIIRYTTDGSTPTAISTSYTGPITVNARMIIKAYASDNYGSSAVTEATYTVKEDALVIDVKDPTIKVQLTYKTGENNNSTGTTTINLDSTTHPVVDGVEDTESYRNVIPYSSISGLYNKTLTAVAFKKSDDSEGKTLVKRIYSGEGIYPSAAYTFDGFSSLVYADIKLSSSGNLERFVRYGTTLTMKVRGTASGFYNSFSSNGSSPLDIDLSDLMPTDQEGFTSASSIIGGYQSTLRVGEHFKFKEGTSVSSFISRQIGYIQLNNLYITSSTPPDIRTVDWLGALIDVKNNGDDAAHKKLTIHLPSSAKETYKSADETVSKGWADYVEINTGASNNIVWEYE